MNRIPPFCLALAWVLGVAACGDNGVAPVGDPMEQLEGTWSASSFTYTSVANPEVSVPVLAAVEGSSVSVTVQRIGVFVAFINLGPQTHGETVELSGTITYEGDSQLAVIFEANPYFTSLDVTYAFQTVNTLSWEAPTVFVFDEEEGPEPAILTVVFQRS